MFHSDGVHSARIKLGDINPTLNEDAAMTFTGDVCETTKVPRTGTIKVECGCRYLEADSDYLRNQRVIARYSLQV